MSEAAAETAQELEAEIAESTRSDWVFWDEPPTKDEVRGLLETLPPVYGIETVNYLDFVQALPQQTKMPDIRDERGRKVRPSPEYRDTWTLYCSVAGRIKMLNDAAELNEWSVDHRPEMHTPDGCPTGFLEFGDRLVYREYCVISKPGRVEISAQSGGRTAEFPEVLLGSKPGTAWVKRTGGSQAAGSNPYEKVETSARGRSIGAWGFGVLPGSGIASLEEMQGVAQNQRDMDAEQKAQAQDDPARAGGSRKTRDELLTDTLTLGERMKQESGLGDEEYQAGLVTYLTQTLGIKNVVTETGDIDWSVVKDGQIQLVGGMFRQRLASIIAAGQGGV